MHFCGKYPNLRFVVFVRSPIQRFVSAWISRFDRDQEGHNPWTKEEEWGFTRFQSPAELACALTSPHAEVRQDASRAMMSSPHLHLDLYRYVGKFLNPKKRCLGNFLFVGRTEHIDEDVDRLSTLLEQRRVLQTRPSRQEAVMRQGSDKMRPYRMLNQCAVEGLREWYRRDYKVIQRFVKAGLLDKSYLSELEQVEALGWQGLAR